MEQSATNKILCPYCGSKMKMPTITNARWVIDNARLYKGNMTCTNPDCAAVSPTLYECYDLPKLAERVTEAALKRFKPLQKPLTAEEIGGTIYTRPCWIERIIPRLAEGDEPLVVIEPDVLDMDSVGYYGKINLATFHDVPYMYLSQYNKTWRCWTTKPTEEERQVAEWEK